MLAEVVTCTMCGAEAIKSVKCINYAVSPGEIENPKSRVPESIEFTIDCPNCGVSNETRDSSEIV